MDNYYFKQSAELLDNITKEGYFGEDAKQLAIEKENKDNANHFYDCLVSVFLSNNLGMDKVYNLTLLLLELYTEALKINPQEAVDILSAFMKGTKDNPELESQSSYLEWMIVHRDWVSTLDLFTFGATTDNTKLILSTSKLLNSYSKGVELIGKLFTELIAMAKMIKKEEYNLVNIQCLRIYDKLDLFEKNTDEKYHILTKMIDRDIRNADSHLNATYSKETNSFIMRKNVGRGNNKRIETFEVPLNDMVFDIYPRIGWLIQAFMSSCFIIILKYSNSELYKKATDLLISMGDKFNN